MSTWVTNKSGQGRQAVKTMIVYLSISAFCILFDKIYALFGHGVHSSFMSLMFLFPLSGGALPFFLMRVLAPQAGQIRHYRLIYNCYNSGIATLTVGSALNGVMEIAGTSSPYMIAFTLCGWGMAIIACLAFLANFIKAKRNANNPLQ